MSKFKLKFKLQGLELEVEGSKEDVPLLTKAIGAQVANMLNPIIETIDAESIEMESEQPSKSLSIGKIKKKRSQKANNNPQGKTDTSIDLSHNIAKHGSPKQEWTTLEKGIWLLEILEMEKQTGEWTSRQIAETFNKHFRQAKTIRATNIARDFGKAKLGSDALVGENANNKPGKWFLTSKGKEKAKNLIKPA